MFPVSRRRISPETSSRHYALNSYARDRDIQFGLIETKISLQWVMKMHCGRAADEQHLSND